ncbi:MAG: 2Fe-2S iron-sulfur cluster binding domain-containing protein [Kineosporiaceae bacterium]|nr:2Fe-2S iron-sulfur cluster binding domain-containing protein [Kineosporiaceae bacterium]
MSDPGPRVPGVGDARYPVRLTTSDGVTLAIEVPDGSTVIEAALEAGHVLPSQCCRGTCGSCHATARGAYRLGDHSPSALPPEKEAAGEVLLCRTYPLGTVDVALAYPRSRILDGGVGRREGIVVEVSRVARDTVALRLQLDPDETTGAGVEFEPGQFMELQLPGDERRRAYSMTNTGNWDGEVEFLIRLHEGGYFSGFLSELLDGRRPLGERVILHGPTGAFGLRESGLRPRWFVAGGTGLAPLLSLLRRMAEWGDPHPARLFLGVTTEEDLPKLPLLEDLAAQLPTLVVEPCVWEPISDWTGTRGTPADALAAALAGRSGSAPDVYVSGPPLLVDAVTAVCLAAGLPPEHVVTERVLPT